MRVVANHYGLTITTAVKGVLHFNKLKDGV